MKRYLLISLLLLPVLFVAVITIIAEPVKPGLLIFFGLLITAIILLLLVLSPIFYRGRGSSYVEIPDETPDGINCPACKKELSVLRLLFSFDKEIRCRSCNTASVVVLPGRWPAIEKIIIIITFLVSMIFALIGIQFIKPGIIFFCVLLAGLIAILFFIIIYKHKAVLIKRNFESGDSNNSNS